MEKITFVCERNLALAVVAKVTVPKIGGIFFCCCHCWAFFFYFAKISIFQQINHLAMQWSQIYGFSFFDF